MSERIKTPCIGICSTTYGDTVCRGCNRFHHEIIHWNRYTNAQKNLVWQRLEHIILTVLSQKVVIVDSEKLRHALRLHHIRYNEHLQPLTWVHALLNHLDHTELTLNDCGIRCLPDYENFSTTGLCALIQNEVLTLSNAFYDHQIERAFRHEDLTVSTTPSNA